MMLRLNYALLLLFYFLHGGHVLFARRATGGADVLLWEEFQVWRRVQNRLRDVVKEAVWYEIIIELGCIGSPEPLLTCLVVRLQARKIDCLRFLGQIDRSMLVRLKLLPFLLFRIL